jgi:chemotaxis protein methyltransferase CheR
VKSTSGVSAAGAQPGGDTALVWSELRRFARDTLGVVLSEDQAYIVETRVAPLCALYGVRSVRQLVTGALDGTASAALLEGLVEALTTHETSFFRDPRFWDAIAQHVLPAYASPARPFRVWSAACSRGQEIFTTAVLLAERQPHLVAQAELYASDVSRASVDAARAGVVSDFEARRGLSATQIGRFFEPVPDGYRLRAPLLSSITFFQNNLVAEAPYPRSFDLVLCRNVLIYMSDADKLRVVRRLVEVTRKDGFIAVGASEMLPGPALAPGLYARESVARALGDVTDPKSSDRRTQR